MSDETEYVPVHTVAYENAADVDYNPDTGRIENHDELVENGDTYDEIVMMRESQAIEHGLESEIVRPGDVLWSDDVAELGQGDSLRLDERGTDD